MKTKYQKAKKEISRESIEEDIVKAISVLSGMKKEDLQGSEELAYKSLKVSQKVEDYTLCVDIENRVTKYFNFVKESFKRFDPNGDRFELICVSVKKVYLKLKTQSLSQNEIFDMITDWFVAKTHGTKTVCEIMTSFFVQNCDIYDEISK